jgi:hypothetical protein
MLAQPQITRCSKNDRNKPKEPEYDITLVHPVDKPKKAVEDTDDITWMKKTMGVTDDSGWLKFYRDIRN